jgi:predicted PurR-regulated permease PerM
LNKHQEHLVVSQFKEITDSLVYGQIIIGIAQGIIAGIGFVLFGVEGAFILTILAIIMSIIPVIGPAFVWVPVLIFMYIQGDHALAFGFLFYNLLLTSTIDNFLRPYIVSRKTNLPQVIVLVGMIGGWMTFGMLGLIIGPLLLAYILTFLRAYKERALSGLFG